MNTNRVLDNYIDAQLFHFIQYKVHITLGSVRVSSDHSDEVSTTS